MDLTKEYFDKYLRLENGLLYWKYRCRSEFSCDRTYKSTNARLEGKLAECISDKGRHKHKVTRIKNKLIGTHRIVFCMYYGYMPKLVDHIDGNALNNNPLNLRECTNSENLRNRGMQKNNTTGYKGVTFDKNAGKYMCQIGYNGKNINGGHFDCKIKAALKYNELAIKYHGEFAKLNEV